ncbi:hypothetical protein [Rhodopseudomonas palustris]|uniref:hypothetical protein n=1 Tax=Rhodopseudomonas palustris TaxID=1076 RepID=UPI0006740046
MHQGVLWISIPTDGTMPPMGEPNLVRTLETKRKEIERTIRAYEKQIEICRRDLYHINATLVLFEHPDKRTQFPVYMNTLRLFKPREMTTICREALAKEGPLDTRELAIRVIRAKGLDEGDRVLRTSIAFRIVQALNMAAKRGKVTALPKRKGVRVWAS